MWSFACREGLLAFGTDEGRVGWVEALTQRSKEPAYSSYKHRGGVYSVTFGPALGEEKEAVMLYTVGDGKIIQHNTRTGKFTDIQEWELY